MKIEAIDLFYIALPQIKMAADGSQDSLVVRVRTDNGLVGWGECDASPLPSIAAYIAPMSHSNIININESLLGETLESPDDVRRLRAKVGTNSLDIEQLDHAVAGADIAQGLAAQDIEIDRHAVRLKEPLKELGVFDVRIKLPADIETTVKVWIVEE